MTFHINDLPNEILTQIFYHVEATPPNSSILSCLVCCRYWYELSLLALYRDVFLQNHNTNSFTQQLLRQPTKASMIKSLSTYMNPESTITSETPAYQNEETKELLHAIETLPLILPHMTNLTMLSLSIQTRISQFEPANESMTMILSALPKSCIALELNLDHMWFNAMGTGPAHLCPSIAALLPRLRHLHLSMGVMCTDLIKENHYPSLRSLVIMCGLPLSCPEDRGQPETMLATQPACIVLSKHMRELREKGCVPNLERLYIRHRE